MSSATAKLVLMTLADQASDTGLSCFPSHDKIAEAALCSSRTVVRCIAELEELGLIVVDRPAKLGRGRYNRYGLVVGELSIEAQAAALVRERTQDGRFDSSIWAGNDLERKVTNWHLSSVDIQVVDNSGMVTPVTEMVTPVVRNGDTAVSPNPSLPVDKPSGQTVLGVDFGSQAAQVRLLRSTVSKTL